LADLPDWLRIPDGFASSGDPIADNPFPSDDLRHQVWQEATREAEEEWARVNHHWLSSLSPTNAWDLDWFLALQAARFDVWAKRGIHVVWSDPAVTNYDDWLFRYGNATLEGLRKSPPPFSTDQILLAVRNRLAERILYWKAEARRYRSEQEQNQRETSTLPNPSQTEPPGATPQASVSSAITPSRAQCVGSRKAVLEPLLTHRGWSTLDLAQAARVDYNTANDYLNGLTNPRRDTLKKLADALGVSPTEMPE
jgi:hypothetical protein